MLSAREAATAVGMTKAGIIRSIHTGKLSATRDANQQFQIDPAELFRVYTPVSTTENSELEIDDDSTPCQCDSLRLQVAMLDRRILDKEEVIRAKDQVIEGKEAEIIRLEAVVAQYSPSKAQRGWWSRLLGGA